MKKAILYSVFTSLSFILISTGCQREVEGNVPNNPPPVAQTVNADVRGRVINDKKEPVSGAMVSTANGGTATTDINGEFSLQNVLLNKNAGFIKVEKAGYFTGSRTFIVSTTAENNTLIQLIPKTNAGTFIATAGGNITISNGGSVIFPANAIVTTNNTAYTGNVSVAAHFLNPDADNINEIMPGTLRGVRSDNSQVALQTFGMMAVELTGANGEVLKIASGKTASINFPIAASLLSSAPASIPLWYFNETTGLWKEEGVATKQGSSYIGQVAHFSFWNCDAPFALVDFEVILKNQNGQPIAKANVVLTTGNTKTPISGSGVTSSDGKVAGKIPANSLLNMEVTNSCGDVIYSKTITTTTANINLGSVTVTIANPANVTISGTVKDCSAAPVTNGFVHIAIGNITHRAQVNNGAFSAVVAMCSSGNFSALIKAYDLSTNKQSDSVTLAVNTTTPSTVQLNACQNTIDQFVNYTVNGTGYSLIAPVDSFNYFTQSNTDYLYVVSRSIGQKVNLSMQNVTATGTVPLQMLALSLNDSSFFGQNITTVTITEYNSTPAGTYVAGNLSGVVKADSIMGNVTHPVNLSFRIKK